MNRGHADLDDIRTMTLFQYAPHFMSNDSICNAYMNKKNCLVVEFF